MTILTQEQKDFFERKEEELKAQFSEPQYVEYTIKYVKNPRKADVKISKQHIIFDYLAIGMACLSKEIKSNSKKKVIYAVHQKYPTMEDMRLHDLLFPPAFGGHSLPPNALTDLMDETSLVLQTHFHDEKYSTFLSGLLVYQCVTTVAMGYSEDSNVTLDFENFNDTIAAQKLAFETLKKLTISNCLGALYAFFYGDD